MLAIYEQLQSVAAILLKIECEFLNLNFVKDFVGKNHSKAVIKAIV